MVFSILLTFFIPVKADFGDADLPVETINKGSQTFHDAFCLEVQKKCRVVFQRDAMWIEGQGGIKLNQFISYRSEIKRPFFYGRGFYNYITYKSKDGDDKEALFIFINNDAQYKFMRKLRSWIDQIYFDQSDAIDS